MNMDKVAILMDKMADSSENRQPEFAKPPAGLDDLQVREFSLVMSCACNFSQNCPGVIIPKWG
jgi:hypothetical protein